MTQRELKQEGKTFIFSNEKYQESIQNDDVRSAEVSWEEVPNHPWATGFKIYFNCSLIHSSKTFKSCERKLNSLIDKWHLELDDILDENGESEYKVKKITTTGANHRSPFGIGS